jgi:hypothetical protein
LKHCRLELVGSHQFTDFAEAFSLVPQLGRGYRNEWLTLEAWMPTAQRFPTHTDVKAANLAERTHDKPVPLVNQREHGGRRASPVEVILSSSLLLFLTAILEELAVSK